MNTSPQTFRLRRVACIFLAVAGGLLILIITFSYPQLSFRAPVLQSHALNWNMSSPTLKFESSGKTDLVGQIWPRRENETFDRQLNQLEYMDKYAERRKGRKNATMKRIFLVGGFDWHTQRQGQVEFIEEKCPINECMFATKDSMHWQEADAFLITAWDIAASVVYLPKPKHQIWITHHVESPRHSPINCALLKDNVNWTISYRRDSTLFFNSAVYEQILSIDSSTNTNAPPPFVNYAANKTRLVAALVTNCNPSNDRKTYTEELQKYITVHVYGSCGQFQCPPELKKKTADGGLCANWVAEQYKFYLAFENSNCKDYITEKLMMNALRHNIIPVVLGAFPEDYQARAPPHSYINVDDFSNPQELAVYLNKLDKNDTLYNEYFAWKKHWSYREYPQERYLCRLCMLLHLQQEVGYVHWYQDYCKWWDVCKKR